MAEGESLLATASSLNSLQKKEDGEQRASTVDLNLAIEEANKAYIPHLKIARIAFKNDANRWVQLELTGARKNSHSGWLGQTNVFYTNLLADEDALNKMALFGQTTEKLEAAFSLIKSAEQKLALRKKEMGEAQRATKDRDDAVEKLNEWYTDYIEIARIALSSQPQYLEMLGIVEPS